MCVPSPDTDVLRFLWRKYTDTEIKDYMMGVHIFGKTDSPCAANCAFNQLKKIIKENFYMGEFFVFHEP